MNFATEYQKSQQVRILDMVVLAPFLVIAGTMPSNLPPIVKLGLITSGILTFTYNANNYLSNLRANQE